MYPWMPARMLLKSWAIPPASGPDGLHLLGPEKLGLELLFFLFRLLSQGDVADDMNKTDRPACRIEAGQ